jgi:hypothetical protein
MQTRAGLLHLEHMFRNSSEDELFATEEYSVVQKQLLLGLLAHELGRLNGRVKSAKILDPVALILRNSEYVLQLGAFELIKWGFVF